MFTHTDICLKLSFEIRTNSLEFLNQRHTVHIVTGCWGIGKSKSNGPQSRSVRRSVYCTSRIFYEVLAKKNDTHIEDFVEIHDSLMGLQFFIFDRRSSQQCMRTHLS
jgi:hypothetical protein